jgi:MFS family permease
MGMMVAPAMAATGQYFNKKRGAALGLAVAGSSLGGVVWPIALGKMLYNRNLGFGWSVRISGLDGLLEYLVSSCSLSSVPHAPLSELGYRLERELSSCLKRSRILNSLVSLGAPL